MKISNQALLKEIQTGYMLTPVENAVGIQQSGVVKSHHSPLQKGGYATVASSKHAVRIQHLLIAGKTGCPTHLNLAMLTN